MNELVSIIVPVYNSQDFISRCLESLVRQSYSSIEILVIDDGSTDNSKNIIKKYLEKYKNIFYFYKENGGQASARNLGIDLSKGDYICFVDSDDIISLDFCKLMVEKDIKESADIVSCNIMEEIGDIKIIHSYKTKSNSKREFMIKLNSPCNLLIKKNIFKNSIIKFPIGYIFEDIAIIPALVLLANNVAHVDQPLYVYIRREDSTTGSKVFIKKHLDIIKAIDHLVNLFTQIDKKNEYYDEIEYIVVRRLLISGGMRLAKTKDGKQYLNLVANYMDKFPNWIQNQYVKSNLTKMQKIAGRLIYKRHFYIIYCLNRINSLFKKYI